MSKESTSPSEIKILLIFRNLEPKTVTRAILENTYPGQLKITEIPLLQDAIESLEKKEANFDLIFFEHESATKALVQALLGLGGSAQFIMCASDEQYFQNYPHQPEFMLTKDINDSLSKVLKKFSNSGKLPPLPVLNQEAYITVNPHTLLAGAPLKSDIYVLLGQGRHVCIFRKGDELEKADLQKYLDKKTVALFYMKKSDCAVVLKAHVESINAATEKSVVTQAEAESTFVSSSELVRDLVSQIGFTEETQEIAKSSVALALKSMGSSPRLSTILANLENRKGDYIAIHSFMVGQIACALAHKIGWNSTGTFYKLTLSAFLHDIVFTESRLAEIHDFEKAKASGDLSPEDLKLLRSHPIKASEYSKQFTEIPSDIDVIIAQHHEKPEGGGYPRELGGKAIAPLSALFIVAHDLVNYSKDHPDTTIEEFVKANASRYDVGQFKKILAGMG